MHTAIAQRVRRLIDIFPERQLNKRDHLPDIPTRRVSYRQSDATFSPLAARAGAKQLLAQLERVADTYPKQGTICDHNPLRG
jgi:hypothetical protein